MTLIRIVIVWEKFMTLLKSLSHIEKSLMMTNGNCHDYEDDSLIRYIKQKDSKDIIDRLKKKDTRYDIQ